MAGCAHFYRQAKFLVLPSAIAIAGGFGEIGPYLVKSAIPGYEILRHRGQ
jgi:hypothetical protein